MSIKNQWLKKPEIQTSKMIELYDKGLSSEQIGKELGLAKSSVSRRLKKVGVKLRSSKDYEGENRYWLWKGTDYLSSITRKRNQRKHRLWSRAVLERDGNVCTNCGNKHHRLHAHHIVALKDCLNFPLEFDISNGITLCPKCHKQKHKQINAMNKY